MSYFYSAATRGFYTPAIHASIPPDAVPVSDDQHVALMAGQLAGQVIAPDASGNPVLAAPSAPTTVQQAATARAQRDALMNACDWTQATDSPLPVALKTAWATYRTTLRNLPAQPGFPQTIAWPADPSVTT